MARTMISPELLEAFLLRFRYQLARGEDTRPGSPVNPTRADLDHELEVIRCAPDVVARHELARQIRSHLNQHSLFYRLPIEVVSVIFHLVVHDGTLQDAEPAKEAIKISSISRLWREIATEMCPTLWTKLDALPTPLLDLFLSRSRSAPLEILFTPSAVGRTVEILEFLERVVPHIHRWRVCRIVYDTSPGEQDVLKLLQEASAPAPQLEVLQLNFMVMYDPTIIPLEFLDPFCGITPRLRTIDCDFYVPMSSPIFRGLTNLHLSWTEYPEPDPIQQLLGIIELCPLLESISLMNLTFSTIIPVARVSGPIIALHHLQKLSIAEEWGTPWAQFHFLPRLIIPVSCILDITANVRWSDDLRHILPQRTNFLPSLPDIFLCTRSMHCAWRGYDLSLRGRMLVDIPDAFAFNFLYSTESHNPDDIDACARIISSFGTSFPLPFLEEVVISRGQCRDSDPTSVLEHFFRMHPTIKIVALSGCWPWGSILELFVVAPTRQICPLLQDLYFTPAQSRGLDEGTLLEAVKSRTVPAVDGPFLCGVTALQRLFLGLHHERVSASVLSALQNHVTVDFKDHP